MDPFQRMLLDQFLAENPHHRDGVRTELIEGFEETVMRREVAAAFADWAANNGHTTPGKAMALKSALSAHARQSAAGRLLRFIPVSPTENN